MQRYVNILLHTGASEMNQHVVAPHASWSLFHGFPLNVFLQPLIDLPTHYIGRVEGLFFADPCIIQ